MSTFIPKQVHLLQHWITERERIRQQHDARPQPPRPWTRDRVLDTYSFCNVRRMDDRVSKWLFNHWYVKAAPPHNLLVQATLARLINEPRTLATFETPLQWNTIRQEWWGQQLKAREGQGLPVYTSAYLVTGAEYSDGGKAMIIPRITTRVAQIAVTLINTHTMQEMHEGLMTVKGLGSFLAGQITADMRHLRGARYFPDRVKWAPLGPGSARGMARLLGKPVKRSIGMGQEAFMNALLELRTMLTLPEGVEGIDLQNCLCEFDKYCRAVQDGRRPRRLYRGGVRDMA